MSSRAAARGGEGFSRRRIAAGRPALGVLLASVVLGLTGLTAIARADGDPASDYLVTNHVFLGSGTSARTPAQQRLLATVAAANRAGFAIRVAVVGTEYDLGSITALWRKPQLYARFLGLELSSVYRGRLLVAMPGGYGFNWPGHPATTAAGVIGPRSPGVAPAALTAAAAVSVRALAARAGVHFTVPAAARPGAARSAHGPAGSGVPVLVIVLAGLLLLVVAGFVSRFRLAGARKPRRDASAPTGPGTQRRRPSRAPGWGVQAFAGLCLVALLVPIVVLLATRGSRASTGVKAAAIVTPPPFTWPAGRQPAPQFTLRDQTGAAVSPARFRGRPVIVTFVDPLCRNLCPLEAHVLNAAVARMPPAQRPVILAVSVDVWADSRADLHQDVGKWSLVPEWHWAVGSRSALARVWKQYKVGVSVVTRRIAHERINYITHSELAYVVDASGHERALFLWPFYPQDVVRVLRRIA